MSLQSQVFGQVRNSIPEQERIALCLELANELGVAGKIVTAERAETMAQNIAKDIVSSRNVKHGDTIQTPQGPAVAVVLTPEELLRRLS